jgi:hypothetical protein
MVSDEATFHLSWKVKHSIILWGPGELHNTIWRVKGGTGINVFYTGNNQDL